MKVSRRLGDIESRFKTSRSAVAPRRARRGGAPSAGRCLQKAPREAPNRIRETGGILSIVCMRTNIILSMWGMFQNEDHDVKFRCGEELKSIFGTADVVCHDCGCRISAHMISMGYAKNVYMDSPHASVHSCNGKFHPDGKQSMEDCNIQVVEQLWSRMDKLHFATNFSVGRYRAFPHHSCIWRN